MTQQASAADWSPASWAVLLALKVRKGDLHLFVVAVDTLFAELVQAGAHILRFLVNSRADLAL